MDYITGWIDYDRFTVCEPCANLLRDFIYAADGIDICMVCQDPIIDDDTIVKCTCHLDEWRVFEPNGHGR
jgi:hypothetical protein